MYREEQTGGSFMMGVLTGAFVGAGLALLFAPKSGNEMRAQLGEQTQHLRTSAGQWKDAGRERVQQLSSQLSDRMSSSSDRQGTTQSQDAERFPSSAPSV